MMKPPAPANTQPGNNASSAAAVASKAPSGASPAAAAGPVPGAASASSRSTVDAELQRQIEEALPERGRFKELYGAAGTPVDQRRESPIVEMSLLLAEAVMHGLRTIAFCKSRKLCELIVSKRCTLMQSWRHVLQYKCAGQYALGSASAEALGVTGCGRDSQLVCATAGLAF
jgi:hypothetical protein